MISYQAALNIIAARTRPLPMRTVPLADAAGSVAAADVRSAAAVPSFANAAMDGFALSSVNVGCASPTAPVDLAIAGSVVAGQAAPKEPLRAAWEITTGAVMPAGCDAVLALERAQVLTAGSDRILRVTAPIPPGHNRRDAGTDFAPGDLLLRAGDRVTAAAVMALAAVGCDQLDVRTAPRIAILTTGSELGFAGPPDAAGRIRDANGPYLAALLRELGLPLVAHRTVPDDPGRLIDEIATLSPACDLILTTGGVSAGRLDFVPAAIERMGGTIHFHKVAIRPGKPLLYAQLAKGPMLFGLPGNPMAVAVGLRFFVIPAVRFLMGRPPERHVPARCTASIRKREGLTFFAKAVARMRDDASLEVEVLPGQESFRISPLLRANCWAIVQEGRQDVATGDLVEVAPLLPTDFPAPVD